MSRSVNQVLTKVSMTRVSIEYWLSVGQGSIEGRCRVLTEDIEQQLLTDAFSMHRSTTRGGGGGLLPYIGYIQGFWYFAWSRSREFQVNPRNSLEILPNTCRHNIFESYLGCWGCSLAVNLLIYKLETSSPQQVNNIPKLPGVLRLMLWKTGKQRCKIPGVPSVDHGNWGWECNSLFYPVLALREECCVFWRITPYMFISPIKMTIFFETVRSTNDNARKPAKWAKFMLSRDNK